MAGTTCDSRVVISPGGIGKSIITMNFNNLGSAGSFCKFAGLISGLINFYDWNDLAWAKKLLSQPSQSAGLVN